MLRMQIIFLNLVKISWITSWLWEYMWWIDLKSNAISEFCKNHSSKVSWKESLNPFLSTKNSYMSLKELLFRIRVSPKICACQVKTLCSKSTSCFNEENINPILQLICEKILKHLTNFFVASSRVFLEKRWKGDENAVFFHEIASTIIRICEMKDSINIESQVQTVFENLEKIRLQINAYYWLTKNVLVQTFYREPSGWNTQWKEAPKDLQKIDPLSWRVSSGSIISCKENAKRKSEFEERFKILSQDSNAGQQTRQRI